MLAQISGSDSPWRQWLLVALALLAESSVARADIVLYEFDGYRGRSFVTDQTIANFAGRGFNDKASSAVIRGSSWQLCTDSYFGGRCVTLPPGEYPTLRSMQLENQVSSARELGWQGRPGGGPGGPRPSALVELFEGNRFDGRVFPVNGAISDFTEFNDRASSMVIHDGHWEACENIGYRGACQVYGPGRYPNLGGMANRISSIRPVAGPGPGPGPAGSVELYEGEQFTGAGFGVDAPTPGLPSEFNDRARSMIVHGGSWEICDDVNFRGGCQVYAPGRHASLGALSGRVSSLRPVSGPGPGPGPGAGGWGGGGARAMLYEGPNLSGRTFVIDAEVMPDLDRARFNDRASSLRVEGGYWLFCSDINFGGECLTFGPGDYPTLPWSLNNKISSGRRIRDQYPYSQSPNWQR